METEGMTQVRLEAYRSNNDEIKELQGKLQKMGTEEGKEKLDKATRSLITGKVIHVHRQ